MEDNDIIKELKSDEGFEPCTFTNNKPRWAKRIEGSKDIWIAVFSFLLLVIIFLMVSLIKHSFEVDDVVLVVIAIVFPTLLICFIIHPYIEMFRRKVEYVKYKDNIICYLTMIQTELFIINGRGVIVKKDEKGKYIIIDDKKCYVSFDKQRKPTFSMFRLTIGAIIATFLFLGEELDKRNYTPFHDNVVVKAYFNFDKTELTNGQ